MSRRIVYGSILSSEVATCDEPGCLWKYRGRTAAQTVDVVERHVRVTGHSVTLRVVKEMTLSEGEDG